MKILLLSVLFFIGLGAFGQQTFYTPGIPPSTTSFSPTFRFKVGSTDSLNTVWISQMNKWYRIDLSPQTWAYFSPDYFAGSGTNVGDPVIWNPAITFQNDQIFNLNTHNLILKNLPQGFNGDSIAVWHNGILSRAVDNPAASPNQIINGLNFILIDSISLKITTGVYRINNHFYSIAADTTITISSRDNDSSRYDAIYADTLNRVGRVQGVLSGTPVIPDIPDGTLYIGSVLITPTGPNLLPVNAYLPLTLTGSTHVRGDSTMFLRFEMIRPGTGNASFEMNGITPFYDFYVQANTSGEGSELTGDTTGQQIIYTDELGKSDYINMGHYTFVAKGIEARIDDTTATFRMRTSANQNAIHADNLAFATTGVVRSLIDSAGGGGNTIYKANDSLINDRTVFFSTHLLKLGDTTINKAILTIDPTSSIITATAADAGGSSGLISTSGGSNITAQDTLQNTGEFSANYTNSFFSQTKATVPAYALTFDITNNKAVFLDSLNHKGIEYNSKNYTPTDATLIDKYYADNHYAASSGTVTSVSGTTNRITSTGGTTPVIDISAIFETLLGKVANPLSQFASTTSAQLAGVLSDESGTGVVAYTINGVFTTPNLGTPSALVGTNITGTGSSFTAGNINGTTNGTITTLSALSLPYSQLTGTPTLLTASNFVYNETPTGTINGSNVTFTIANAPQSGKSMVFRNGIKQPTTAYSISSTTLTETTAPLTGDTLEITYIK